MRRPHPVIAGIGRRNSIAEQNDSRQETKRLMRLGSMATMIPAVMVIAPLLGMGLGHWIGGKFEHAPAGALIGLAIGLAAGVRETVRLIRRIAAETDSGKGKK